MFSDGKKKQAGTDLFLGVDGAGVDHLGSVLDEALDLAGFGKLLKAFISLRIVSLKAYLDSASGEGATDLHTIGDDGGSDDLVVGNLLPDLVVDGLIEDASVGELVPDLEGIFEKWALENLILPFPWTTSSWISFLLQRQPSPSLPSTSVALWPFLQSIY